MDVPAEEPDTFVDSDYMHGEENFRRYRVGGYHPVALGDVFKHGRYKTTHKLGFGGFSTVWLANDLQEKRWVSLKILTADASVDAKELRILQTFARHREGEPGSQHIVKLRDDFIHEGPNGKHQCMVFDVLGPTLAKHIEKNRGLYGRPKQVLGESTVLEIAEQLLTSVSFIHEAGYGHGDISTGNIVLKTDRFSEISEAELFYILGEPKTKPVIRRDGAPIDDKHPKQLIGTTLWPEWDFEEMEGIFLIDFGETFRQGSEPPSLAQPLELRAPETMLTDRFDYRIDLWRVGVAIYECIMGGCPFFSFGPIFEMVDQVVGFVGDLPAEWQQKYDELRKASGEVAADEYEDAELDEKFRDHIHNETLKQIRPIIRGLMALEPSKRTSASQALEAIKELQRNMPSDNAATDQAEVTPVEGVNEVDQHTQ